VSLNTEYRLSLDYIAYMQLYITATQMSDCDYQISKMCCPMMSVILKVVSFYEIARSSPLCNSKKHYILFR